jgi:hypothetical protein
MVALKVDLAGIAIGIVGIKSTKIDIRNTSEVVPSGADASGIRVVVRYIAIDPIS